MWRKHRSIFKDHVKYIHYDIVKTFRVGILRYAEHVHEMQDLAQYLPPRLKQGDEYDQLDWDVRDKELSEEEIAL